MVLRFYCYLILLCFIKAPLSWGLSLDSYLDQAEKKQLHLNQAWLRLGHYHKNLFGNYYSKIRGSFFLAEHGATDPHQELIATIQQMFSEETSAQAQCRFLARRQWLTEQIEIHPQDLIYCDEKEKWKQQFNAREAYLIFASSDLNSAASSFGHTFLRLHNPDNFGNLDLIDYGINFAADTRDTEGFLYALKGLFGMFPGYYSMMPYHQKLREYINLEGRDIWEFMISLDAAQVDQIVNHLLELQGTYVPYYFLDENCSYQILELLEVGDKNLDVSKRFVDLTLPIDTLKVLDAIPNYLINTNKRSSIGSQLNSSYNKLNFVQKQKLKKIIQGINERHLEQNLFEFDIKLTDITLQYLAQEKIKYPEVYGSMEYSLLNYRSKLGLGSSNRGMQSDASPAQAHDSSALHFSLASAKGQAYFQFKFRRAFHDILQNDDGLRPFNHVEFASITANHYFLQKRTDLDSIQILKIISTSPVTPFQKNFSWKTDLGTENKLSPYVEGGFGYSFDLATDSRWVLLGIGRSYINDEIVRAALGLEQMFLTRYNSKIRSLISLKYLGGLNDLGQLSVRTGLALDLSKGLEMRLQYENRPRSDDLMVSFVL